MWPWRHQLFFVMFDHLIMLFFSLRFHGKDLTYILLVDKLALITVGTLPWRLFMPLLAHLGLVVLVEALWRWLNNKFVVTVSISAIVIELAETSLHEVPAQLCLVIQFEVLNVSQHLLSGLKVHLLLFSGLFA